MCYVASEHVIGGTESMAKIGRVALIFAIVCTGCAGTIPEPGLHRTRIAQAETRIATDATVPESDPNHCRFLRGRQTGWSTIGVVAGVFATASGGGGLATGISNASSSSSGKGVAGAVLGGIALISGALGAVGTLLKNHYDDEQRIAGCPR